MRLWSSSEYTANAVPCTGATMSASVSDPLPPPVPPDSQLPLEIPLPIDPATRLNWFLIADETHGPAISTTRTMIAMIRTYSTVDCPFGRRVNLGDTPPRKEFPLRSCAAPFGLDWLMLQRIDAISTYEITMPQRHMGDAESQSLNYMATCSYGYSAAYLPTYTPTGLHNCRVTRLYVQPNRKSALQRRS